MKLYKTSTTIDKTNDCACEEMHEFLLEVALNQSLPRAPNFTLGYGHLNSRYSICSSLVYFVRRWCATH